MPSLKIAPETLQERIDSCGNVANYFDIVAPKRKQKLIDEEFTDRRNEERALRDAEIDRNGREREIF